jgi:hypothetical protein
MQLQLASMRPIAGFPQQGSVTRSHWIWIYQTLISMLFQHCNEMFCHCFGLLSCCIQSLHTALQKKKNLWSVIFNYRVFLVQISNIWIPEEILFYVSSCEDMDVSDNKATVAWYNNADLVRGFWSNIWAPHIGHLMTVKWTSCSLMPIQIQKDFTRCQSLRKLS